MSHEKKSRAIRVFEPALCCNTGVCGPDVDEALVRFTADLDFLKKKGVDIERHNLANDPSAFATSPAVVSFLKVSGSAGLPLVLVDDVTAVTGRYPDRGELVRFAGIEENSADTAPPSGHTELGLADVSASDGCCGGSGCC